MVRMRRDSKGRFIGKAGHHRSRKHHRRKNPAMIVGAPVAKATAARAGAIIAKRGGLATVAKAARVILVR